MAINKAENDLDNRLVNEIADLKRELLLMKGTQAIGGDALAIDAFPNFSSSPAFIGPITVPSKEQTIIYLTVNPAQNKLTLITPLVSVYVDFYNPSYHFPGGASITPELFDVSVWDDLHYFNQTTNSHKFIIIVDNYDPTMAHDIYVEARVLLPQLTGTTT